MARALAGLISALALAGATHAATAADRAPDRYGPATASPVPAPLADVYAPTAAGPVRAPRETARAAPVRMLSWPGKEAASPPSSVATSMPSPTPAPTPARGAYAPPAPGPTAYAPAAYTPVAVASRPDAPAARLLPPAPFTVAKAVQPASAAPVSAPTGGARLYSVHRAYGMQPDPAPIPPAFFGPTADLGAPVTPDPVPNRAANAASRNAVNAARLAAGEAN